MPVFKIHFFRHNAAALALAVCLPSIGVAANNEEKFSPKKARSTAPSGIAPRNTAPTELHPFVIGSVNHWWAYALKRYQALSNLESPFRVRYQAALNEMHAADPAFFERNDWPLRLADYVNGKIAEETVAAATADDP